MLFNLHQRTQELRAADTTTLILCTSNGYIYAQDAFAEH